jgi:hypothetical protein
MESNGSKICSYVFNIGKKNPAAEAVSRSERREWIEH